MTASLDTVAQAVRGWLTVAKAPLIVGICGAQGSGKSTLAAGLAQHLTEVKVAVLSLDDLYLARESRPVDVSPLFAVRGVPGTHDTDLGLRILAGLKAGQAIRLPRFDKATDSPLPETAWPEAVAPDVILFEGWCVGARPQDEAELATPVNDLEHSDDGRWRRAVNNALTGRYADLFGHIDHLVLLAAPDFSVVRGWRIQQEHDLRRRLIAEGRDSAATMSDAEIGRFVQYYQRLTEHILHTMPSYADLTIALDASRNMKSNPIY